MVMTESKSRIRLNSKVDHELIIEINFSEDVRDIHCDGFHISILRGKEIVAATKAIAVNNPSTLKEWLMPITNTKV